MARRDVDGVDPEFGPPQRGPNGCRLGGRCDGHGWVQVLPAYAERMYPMPGQPQLGSTPEELQTHAAAIEDVRLARAAAENSFYPCKACQPRAFHRWAAGCSEPGHITSECPRCMDAGDVAHRRKANA